MAGFMVLQRGVGGGNGSRLWAGRVGAVYAATAKPSSVPLGSLGSNRNFAAHVTKGRCRTKTPGQNMWDKYGRI